MSKIFLVDCENQFDHEFVELYNARKGDEVHFFISPNAHKIDGYLMNKLKEKGILYWFEECVVDEETDMAKCLIAFLGVMISKYPLSCCEFFIVSNGKGYANPVAFIENTIRGNYSVNYINSFKIESKDIIDTVAGVPQEVLGYIRDFKGKNEGNPLFKEMLHHELIREYGVSGSDYFKMMVKENAI